MIQLYDMIYIYQSIPLESRSEDRKKWKNITKGCRDVREGGMRYPMYYQLVTSAFKDFHPCAQHMRRLNARNSFRHPDYSAALFVISLREHQMIV